jgi:hypothetical protein
MYTSQGYMTGDDYREHLESTDQNTIEVDLASPPEWLDIEGPCAVCGVPIGEHEWVTVYAASGEVVACSETGPYA